MSTTNIELQTVPANAQQISVPVNDALADVDAALAAIVTVEFTTDANRTLTRDEWLATVLQFTDSPSTLSTGRDVVFPARFPTLFVINSTAQTLTLKKTGQTGITVAAGASKLVAAGATDVIEVTAGGAGMTNPMTTDGDIITGGTAGAPQRLAVGTDGHVLTVVSGAPAWQAAGGGSFTGGALSSALDEAKAADIASASTTDIGAAAGNFVHVTGTTTITALGTAQAGSRRVVRFAGALTLTHNATSLILPTGANITTAANDCAVFVSEGSGNWRCVAYQRADGSALSGGGLTGFTATLNTSSPNNTTNASSLIPSGGSTNQDGVYGKKGNAAIQAQVADNATSGGNKRGTNAVDWQQQRTASTEVASGASSCIGGGAQNTASQTCSTVAGGFNCSCAGAYSAIGGGEGNSINSSAQYATTAGGRSNTHNASSYGSAIGGGQSNAISASGTYCAIAGGVSNTAGGTGSGVTNGQNNSATGSNSRVGGERATDRAVTGCDAFANGMFASTGDAQTRSIVLRSDTTDATTEAITSTNAAAGTGNQLVLPNNSAFSVRGHLVVRENATGDCAAFDLRALVRRGASAAATVVVGSTVTMVYNDAGAATWAVAIAADTTNGAMRVNVTGEAAHSLKWVAELEAVEVVG